MSFGAQKPSPCRDAAIKTILWPPNRKLGLSRLISPFGETVIQMHTKVTSNAAPLLQPFGLILTKLVLATELNSPILTNDPDNRIWKYAIVDTLSALKDAFPVRTNSSCGMHVQVSRLAPSGSWET